MRLLLYTGKGGVGKTTTSAATAICAARRGRRSLVASVDAAHSLGDVLGVRLGSDPKRVDANLDALEVSARAEMEKHWGAVRDYLVSLFRYQGIEEVVAEELALLPGAEELAALLAVEAYARGGAYDLVVVDCAPTDSALRLLTLPEVARGAFRLVLRVQQVLAGVVTPLARSVLSVPLPGAEVFRDAERLLFRRLERLRGLLTSDAASVRLVVTPERMVIDEALRAYADLSLFDVPCDAAVLNRLLPEAATRERFFEDWGRLQVERRAEVEALFAPLALLTAPLQDDEVIGLERLAAHGEALFAGCEPDAVLSRPPRVRFTRQGAGYAVVVPLPHARGQVLDVAKLEGELLIRFGERRRALPLPRRIAALELASARLDGDRLLVRFAPPPAGAPPPEPSTPASPKGAQRAVGERSSPASPKGAQRGAGERSSPASPKGAQRGAAERSSPASPKGAQRGAAERSSPASPKGAQRGAAERSSPASPKGAQRGAAERSSPRAAD